MGEVTELEPVPPLLFLEWAIHCVEAPLKEIKYAEKRQGFEPTQRPVVTPYANHFEVHRRFKKVWSVIAGLST